MKNMDFLKKALEIKEKIDKVLSDLRVEAESGGGMVKAVCNGKGRVVELFIEPEVINPREKDMLEDLIIAAVNEAKRRAEEMAQKEIVKITGFQIPGI